MKKKIFNNLTAPRCWVKDGTEVKYTEVSRVGQKVQEMTIALSMQELLITLHFNRHHRYVSLNFKAKLNVIKNLLIDINVKHRVQKEFLFKSL